MRKRINNYISQERTLTGISHDLGTVLTRINKSRVN